jgi:peptidoglycan/xylan/chitin deacetylase (PgdA/CDA1 family)
MRPPYGAINDTVRAVDAQLGLIDVIWTVDTVDWNGVSTAKIVSSALTVQADGFILMHDGYPNTIAAVPQIAAGLAAKGLCPGRIVYSATGTNAWEGLDFPATVAPW